MVYIVCRFIRVYVVWWMMKGEREAVLLERAEVEEKGYNWVEAARLYDEAAKSFLGKKMVEEAAGAYKKLGYAYARAAGTAGTAEEYVELNKRAVKAYKEADNLFGQSGNRPEELECEAEAFYVSASVAASVAEGKKAYSQSYELFIESSELYSKEDDKKSFARTLSRAAWASAYLVNYCSDRWEIEQLTQKGREIADEAWKLSKDSSDLQSLAESLFAEGWLSWTQMTIVAFKWNERWREYSRKFLSRCDESLKLVDGCDDPLIRGMSYLGASLWYCFFGFQFVEDEREQREYFDKGLGLMEKVLVFARKTKDNQTILQCLLWLDWWALYGGRLEYLQKRIFDDLHETLELGKIYAGSYTLWRSLTNFLPAFYYTNFAQRSFFTPDQRKSYAEKAIEYAKESLKSSVFPPFSVMPYEMLTWSHSQLATLATAKDERDENAQKMLQYAKQAEKIAEKYEGGFPRASGYSSLYRAYKTLADIAEDEEERTKMLTAAADAAKKYVGHSVESRTGIIAAQMRVGLLYEELGITTGEIDPLMQARESFLSVIKESLERGYHYYASAAHISIAHVEDRLGNHMASAEHYEKAVDAYEESLKTIEYKPLKDRVQEMTSYARAWNQIERAKAYHKREDHIQAKENYEKACEILKELSRYIYEALYYSAWALQEEAEELSKQERHEEALEKYETARKSFDNAIKTLENASQQPAEKRERERIEKLAKVAKIRMSYCSAREDIERARILGKQGEHLEAAERFASAASKFRDTFTLFKIEQERGELEAVYYLCRAWESMELAEKYEAPDRFAEAANLFTKASELFTDSKLKLLSSGNSAFCQALEYGCKFDESTETQVKAQLYPKIKVMLRKAASSYEKGGFESGADWALATSTYFDAAWHLIRADEELELDERRKLLGIGSRYLKSAADIFGKAGYIDKEEEVLERLDRVEKEEKILVSALNTIREPSISRSTIGIVAPASPVETSLSPRISEVGQFTEEARRVAEERAKKKYELVYRDLLKEYPRIERRECRVAIAQVGVSKTGDILSEFYEEKATGLLGLREDKVETVRSKVKNMIEIARSEGVNILLFPELTIDLDYDQILEDISNLAKTYEMYVIPGSYHDQETKRNISVVVGPDGILWRQEKHIPATISYEGKKFKEGIEVGTTPRKTIVCNTEFGRIAIAICRDFLDMDLRVELKNFEPPVDLIFNPAFTPVTEDFKAAHFDARRSIYAYCFFANVAEFGDSLIYTPEKERVARMIPPGEEDLIYKDVDLFKLRSERKKWEKEQGKERQFIQSTR
jgi:predicted amidohydrolase